MWKISNIIHKKARHQKKPKKPETSKSKTQGRFRKTKRMLKRRHQKILKYKENITKRSTKKKKIRQS